MNKTASVLYYYFSIAEVEFSKVFFLWFVFKLLVSMVVSG